LRNTIEKDLHKNPSDSRTEEGLKDVYERLRPQILKHELMSLKEFYVYGQYEHMRYPLRLFPFLTTIFEIFGESESLRNTIEKDLHKNPSDSRTEEGLKN
jgi:hypothetical protein